MPRASFVQTSFLGGEWSQPAQGRMTDPAYKTAMNVCYNGYPLEAGGWTRRQGFRYLAHTRLGGAGRLLDFDFTEDNPYQVELTDGFARFFAGLGLVTSTDSDLAVLHVSSASPAIVTCAEAVPYSNGDFVLWFTASDPCVAPTLCGRQFKVASVSGNQFALYDGITGAAVDGSTLNYVTADPPDYLRKIFEVATPYVSGSWATVRKVQSVDNTDTSNLLLLHTSYQPRKLSVGLPFSLAAQDFSDGPYMDINTSTTTITPSGTSGSVTLTASATTNINDGDGFQTTDIGRLIRLQGAPVTWSSGSTYATNALVTGSDGIVYTSVKGGNHSHDPTTDDGTWWTVSAQTLIWTWAKITARSTNQVVTATIMGSALPSTAAITSWRLGLYSDTTGWPKCGVYHEGRLWLSGVFPNRIDGSKSNDVFNFEPTAVDGTVADDNAVAATFNARDKNEIYWMLSTDDGLICGTKAGEWRVKASVLDDPISPTSIQARRVSTFGAYNAEPVEAFGTVFIQRNQRKLLSHQQQTATRYGAENLALKADHLTAGGLVEIVWQQEPSLTIWGRRSDGVLVGCNYKRDDTDEKNEFRGWHEHAHADNRVFESISGGPSYDAKSQSLYAITNQTNASDPDHNVRWVEALMPLFDTAVEDWGAFFVDGGGTPCCARKFLVSNGDSFSGLRIYGLYNIVGKTITPVLGGLDLGDRTVQTGGYVDIPFGSDPDAVFTEAFFNALSNGTDYGIFDMGVTFQAPLAWPMPPVTNLSLEAIADDTVTPLSTNGMFDAATNKFYMIRYDGSADTATAIAEYDASDGSLLRVAANKDIWGDVDWDSSAISVYGQDVDNIYIVRFAGSNDEVISKVSKSTLAQVGFYGTEGSSLGLIGSGHIAAPKSLEFIALYDRNGGVHNYLLGTTLTTAFVRKVVILNPDNIIDNSHEAVLEYWAADETAAHICRGISVQDVATYLVWAMASSLPDTGSVGFYEGKFAVDTAIGGGDPGISHSHNKIGTLAPSDIDASWTNFYAVQCQLDETDGNIIAWLEGDSSDYRVVKLNISDLSIMWQATGLPLWPMNSRAARSYCTRNRLMYLYHSLSPAGTTIYEIDTRTGAVTTTTYNAGLLAAAWQIFDEDSSSIFGYATYSESATGPVPVYIGPYLAGHSNSFTTEYFRVYTGIPSLGTDHATTTYAVPASIGMTYTSRGQLLRPDYGVDAGAANGPAFGKKRRIHWWAAQFFRSQKVSIGTAFDDTRKPLYPVKMNDRGDAGNPVVPPTLFSLTATDSLQSEYSFDEMISWEIVRPYPCIIAAMAGYIDTTDK